MNPTEIWDGEISRLHKPGLTGIPPEERTANLAHRRAVPSPLLLGSAHSPRRAFRGTSFGFRLAHLKPHIGWFSLRQTRELHLNYYAFTSIPKIELIGVLRFFLTEKLGMRSPRCYEGNMTTFSGTFSSPPLKSQKSHSWLFGGY